MLRFNKENYRYSLFAAVFLHIVFFLVLFLTLRHNTKLLFLSSPALQVIHATAIPMEMNVKKAAKPEQLKFRPTVISKTLLKPILLKKSPVLLKVKAKKRLHARQQKIIPLKIANKQSSLVKKGRLINKAKRVSHDVSNRSKKIAHKPLKRSKETLKLVEKNIQQLLDQEIKSLTHQSINAARAVTVDNYRHLILQAIAQQWIIPPEMNKHKHLETQLIVHLAPGGMVLEVIIVKSSGNLILDRSAQTAVYKASPLPVPKNRDLFHTFRQINLIVRPEGVMTQ